ncbi:hypothetical protein ACI2OX_08680 [Bacillus sp. N9]
MEQKFSVKWKPKNNGGNFVIPETAVFVKDTITIKNGSITGDIGTIKSGEGSIKIENGSGSITGNIYVPVGSEKIAVSGKMQNITVIGKEMGFPVLPLFPQFPKPTYDIEDIDVKDGTRNFDVSTDKEVVVNNINLHNGSIQLTGTGKLTIYVMGTIELKGGHNRINENGSANQLNIFLKRSNSGFRKHLNWLVQQ